MSFSDDDDFGGSGAAGPGCSMGEFAGGFSDDEDESHETQGSNAGVAGAAFAAASAPAASADGMMHVQSLSGPQVVPAPDQAPQAERGDIMEVTVFYTLRATPGELASGATAPRLELSDKAAGVFDSAGTSADRSKHHILYGADVVSVRNDFPFAVGVNVDCGGCDGLTALGKTVHEVNDGKTVTSNLVLQAGETTTFPQGMKVINGSGAKFDQNKFVKMFPEYNLSNLTKTLQPVHDPALGEKMMIPAGHPATEFYNQVRREAGHPDISEADFAPGTQMYTASADDTRHVIGLLEAELTKGTCDLHAIGFDISRVYGSMHAGAAAPSFDDASEIQTKYASATQAAAAVGYPKMVSIGVKYKYRHS